LASSYCDTCHTPCFDTPIEPHPTLDGFSFGANPQAAISPVSELKRCCFDKYVTAKLAPSKKDNIRHRDKPTTINIIGKTLSLAKNLLHDRLNTHYLMEEY
jgi:hypothetical protein